MTKSILVALSLGLLAGCGVFNSTGSCDFRAKSARCQEREGVATTIAAFEQLCKASGTYNSGPCPRENVLGGCDLSEAANPVRDWYYKDATKGLNTSEDVKPKCEGKTFLAP